MSNAPRTASGRAVELARTVIGRGRRARSTHDALGQAAHARERARGERHPRFVEQAVEIGSEHVSTGRAFWFAANRARMGAGDGRFAVVNLVPARRHAVPHRERALGARDAQLRLGEALSSLNTVLAGMSPSPSAVPVPSLPCGSESSSPKSW